MDQTGDRLRNPGFVWEGLEVTPMALFAGTFENRIDRKGRLLAGRLPCRTAGGRCPRRLCLSVAPGTALEACDCGFMQRMSDSIEQFDIFSDEEDDMTVSIVAAARRITIDTEGRIALPPELIAEAGIEDAVTFVGQRSVPNLESGDHKLCG